MPDDQSSQSRNISHWIHDLQSPLAALRAIRSGEATPAAESLIRGAIASLERMVKQMKGDSPSPPGPAGGEESLADECPAIVVPPGAVVAILDDDPAIHAAWKKRFAELPEGAVVTFVLATNPSEMRLAMREFPDLFLLDHDLDGWTETGLDLIIELGIARQAWLVTGRAFDDAVLARCSRHGVRILSKARIADVPLQVGTSA